MRVCSKKTTRVYTSNRGKEYRILNEPLSATKWNAHRWKRNTVFDLVKNGSEAIESDAIRKFAHANAASAQIYRKNRLSVFTISSIVGWGLCFYAFLYVCLQRAKHSTPISNNNMLHCFFFHFWMLLETWKCRYNFLLFAYKKPLAALCEWNNI